MFKIGAGGLSVAQNASAVLYAGSSLAVSGNATFDTEADVVLNGGTMSATGTVYGGFWDYSYSGVIVIENGGSLTAGALVGSSSYYSVSAGGALTVKGNVSTVSGGYGGSAYYVSGGSFTVKGTFVSTNDGVYASNGAKVQFASLQEDVNGIGVALSADATSSIEIGATGGAAAGTITIDAGKTVTEAGSFTAPTIVDKGTLKVGADQSLTDNGTLEVDGSVVIGAGATLYQLGALTGSGKVTIGAGSRLEVSSDATGSGSVQIAFSGAGGRLALDASDLNASNAFVPAISGFGSTDVIDFTDSGATITGAHYAAASSTSTPDRPWSRRSTSARATAIISRPCRCNDGLHGPDRLSGRSAEPSGAGGDDERGLVSVDRPGRGELERDGELGRCDGRPEPRGGRAGGRTIR